MKWCEHEVVYIGTHKRYYQIDLVKVGLHVDMPFTMSSKTKKTHPWKAMVSSIFNQKKISKKKTFHSKENIGEYKVRDYLNITTFTPTMSNHFGIWKYLLHVHIYRSKLKLSLDSMSYEQAIILFIILQ